MRRSDAQQQKLADDARLLRAWRKWHREKLDDALAGPHGAMVERLVYILKELTLGSAPLLLAFIRNVDWSAIDYDTRLTMLHEVSSVIICLRERNGLSPIDDGLPGERDNVYRIIRSIVTP
jgi:hypothetical protein